jgi:hypothetical protein
MAKPSIAIIGASGKMGTALSRSLTHAGYPVLLFGRDPEKIEGLRTNLLELNATANVECSTCAVDASWEADVIILAVPFAAEADVADRIRAVATQKIVISLSNPFLPDFSGLSTRPGESAGAALQVQLPAAKVVKAFNTVFAEAFEKPVISETKLSVLIAGDDAEAVEVVRELAADMGFKPSYAGGMSRAHILEGMSLLLVNIAAGDQFKGPAGWSILN